MTSLSPDQRVKWGPQASASQDPGSTGPRGCTGVFSAHRSRCPVSRRRPQCPRRTSDGFPVPRGRGRACFGPSCFLGVHLVPDNGHLGLLSTPLEFINPPNSQRSEVLTDGGQRLPRHGNGPQRWCQRACNVLKRVRFEVLLPWLPFLAHTLG